MTRTQKQKQKQISCGSVLPTLSGKYPWLVAQRPKGQIFYTMNDPLSHYWCRIPELLGRRIRGCFHGWVILSKHPHNVMWSLWNPVTSKMIRLPPLSLEDGDLESIKQCCLSSPPNDPTSVFMLTKTNAPTIVYCYLGCKRKKLRWKEMTYAKQLYNITRYGDFLCCLTCCNGKVYALVRGDDVVIQVDIVVKDKVVLISLFAFGKHPFPFDHGCSLMMRFLKGYCTDLFFITVSFVKGTTVGIVYLFKFDWIRMIWEEMEDLKDAIFFVDIAHDRSVFYRRAISSELGGYIHILGDMGKVIYSYDVKDKTISLSSSSCCLVQATHVSLWECRLQGDHEEIKCGIGSKPGDEIVVRSNRDGEVDINDSTRNEPRLLTIPFDILKTIMQLCVGVEYLNFRATCKQCQLAAPKIRWSGEMALKRLQTYSFISPWLIVLDKDRGIITFTDPMFGDKYFMKTPQELICDLHIYCSRYGWLLFYKFSMPTELLFFNPFTNDIRWVPKMTFYLDSVCFSAPPTSPDCMVVGLSASFPAQILIYFINRESSWRFFPMNFRGTTPHSFLCSTFYGEDIYTLNQGALNVFKQIEGRPVWDIVVGGSPRGRSAQYFLVNCNEHHLVLVMVDELRGSVELWKLNDSTHEWEKIHSLGRHMLYICGTTCIYTEAKTPEMENKIYFPRLHSASGKIMFYSLETRRYHTFSGRNIKHCFRDFFGTKVYVYPHAWIEPSWS